MAVILVNAVDEARTRNDSKMDMAALLITATIGIDVFW